MIENMIIETKQYLPLTILEVKWDGTLFQIYGPKWNFTTLSAWRISTNSKIVLGCYDEKSEKLIDYLKNLEIVDIDFQNNLLKIDPVFVLSNDQKIEIFSTDTYEPWTFRVDELGFFSATPSAPEAFDPGSSKQRDYT